MQNKIKINSKLYACLYRHFSVLITRVQEDDKGQAEGRQKWGKREIVHRARAEHTVEGAR